MSTISLTGDHLVPVGGSGTPHYVTVVSGEAVNYSMDRTRTVHGTILCGETRAFEHSAWLWSPSLSAIQVEPVKQPTLNDMVARLNEAEQRPERRDMVVEAAPKHKWLWQYTLAVAFLGCGWVAGVLGAVGVFH